MTLSTFWGNNPLKADSNGVTQLVASGPDVRSDSLRNAILVDDWLAILGSANMDMRSILLNYEIALCFYDSDAIRKLETWIKALTADCSVRQQRQGSSLGLTEGVGRLFAPLL